MSVASSTLPAGWSSILDEMQAHLDRAVALADERIKRLPSEASGALAPARREDLARSCERLGRLSNFLEAAEGLVQSVDEVLQKEEAQLRQELASWGNIRQMLDEAMTRAR